MKNFKFTNCNKVAGNKNCYICFCIYMIHSFILTFLDHKLFNVLPGVLPSFLTQLIVLALRIVLSF